MLSKMLMPYARDADDWHWLQETFANGTRRAIKIKMLRNIYKRDVSACVLADTRRYDYALLYAKRMRTVKLAPFSLRQK